MLRKKLQAAAYGKSPGKGGGVSYSGLFKHFDRSASVDEAVQQELAARFLSSSEDVEALLSFTSGEGGL